MSFKSFRSFPCGGWTSTFTHLRGRGLYLTQWNRDHLTRASSSRCLSFFNVHSSSPPLASFASSSSSSSSSYGPPPLTETTTTTTTTHELKSDEETLFKTPPSSQGRHRRTPSLLGTPSLTQRPTYPLSSSRKDVQLHFPNITFKLIYHPTSPPNEVVFSVPRNLTKLDIVNYLTSIYQLKPIQVRTLNAVRRFTRSSPTFALQRLTQPRFYKKAFVTLASSSTFPNTHLQWPLAPTLEQLYDLNPLFPLYQTCYKMYKKKKKEWETELKKALEPSSSSSSSSSSSESLRSEYEQKLMQLEHQWKSVPYQPSPQSMHHYYLPYSLAFDKGYFHQRAYLSGTRATPFTYKSQRSLKRTPPKDLLDLEATRLLFPESI
ncbi:hypothetical protein HMI54_000299 [Coelomomyces lativittatus]|nr:hypothetical protein HMI54_000299 [Coelomomyces lativittatus]KAJ1512406.1 hypothetical protein HMI55_006239 [Coelomomyces lativittatus]KAJ1514018.1 hypothetical protein HMI56_001329 [Coelomomyces lativittatus]